MATLRINGAEIHVAEMNTDAATTVVMIHGLFTNMSVFYFNIAYELSKRYRVVLYDLKSHGSSQRMPSGYDLDTMAGELLALLDALNLTRVHIAGYSYGALIALKAALTAPDRIDRLALLEAPRPNHLDVSTFIGFRDLLLKKSVDNFCSIFKMKPSGRAVSKIREMSDFLLDHTTFRDDLDRNDSLIDELREHIVRKPVLLLYGWDTDCKDAAWMLLALLPNASVRWELGADHNLPLQRPQWVSNQLLEFLR
ncbi:MAG: alpha/beta hydrolase [Bacteroidales bacterium]|jgi:pimeloyl-ACP methyl ester carboxylesterase|nr:alpha/beta hydrolase [Bacteroidales bacterium]